MNLAAILFGISGIALLAFLALAHSGQSSQKVRNNDSNGLGVGVHGGHS